MAKKQPAEDEENEYAPRPVEKMPYVTRFKLTADAPAQQVYQLLDYCEQDVAENRGWGLCRDKGLRVRSVTGVERRVPWGTVVYPVR